MKKTYWTLLVTLLCLASETAVNTARAAVPEKSGVMRWLEQDYMLGDWGGKRTEWSKHGVDFVLHAA